MFNIFSHLRFLNSCLNTTTLARLCVIVTALLSMTGRVTRLDISRWAGKDGSYRTVQRFSPLLTGNTTHVQRDSKFLHTGQRIVPVASSQEVNLSGGCI